MIVTRPRSALLIVAAASLATANASAQSPTIAETTVGARIELVVRDSIRQGPVLPTQQHIIGRFVRATADSVWLRPYQSTEFSVARSAIRKASVSRGAGRWRSALTLGAGWGFAFATGIALDQIDRDVKHPGRNIIAGTGAGIGLGMILGAVRPYEHWRQVKP